MGLYSGEGVIFGGAYIRAYIILGVGCLYLRICYIRGGGYIFWKVALHVVGDYILL